MATDSKKSEDMSRSNMIKPTYVEPPHPIVSTYAGRQKGEQRSRQAMDKRIQTATRRTPVVLSTCGLRAKIDGKS